MISNTIQEFASNFKNLSSIYYHPITPDIITIAEVSDGKKVIYSVVSESNERGYIPVASIYYGTCRTLGEIGNILKTLFAMATCSQNFSKGLSCLKTSGLGALRGLVEIVPFVGNGILYRIDQYRIKCIEKQVDILIKDKTSLLDVYMNGHFLLGGPFVSYNETMNYVHMNGGGFTYFGRIC